MSELYPDDEETKKLAHTIRLNGKTIFEWHEDCQALGDVNSWARNEYGDLNEKIKMLSADNFRNRCDISDMREANNQLTTDNARLNVDNSHLTKANIRLIAENVRLLSEK